MANGNGLTGELEPFAAAVRRLSGGTLRIEFKSAWREGTSGYETGVIGDVKAGKADLAWADRAPSTASAWRRSMRCTRRC